MAATTTLAVSSAAPALQDPEDDVVLLDGRVIDPETRLDAIRHVAIREGRIRYVGPRRPRGKVTIEAKGLVIAPGFIDLHSHAVMTLAGARMQATDGVTTALELEAGALPVGMTYEAMAREGRPVNYGFSTAWATARVIVDQELAPEEAMPLTPITPLRAQKLREVFGKTTWQGFFPPDKSRKVLELIEQGLREGGLGVGAALGYIPGANADEFYEIAKLAKKYGDSPTYVHIRHNAPYGENNNFASHAEVIGIAAMTGAHLHFCHLNSNATQQIPDRIAAITTARQQGVHITWEAYPYGAGSTSIAAPFLRPENLTNMGIKSSDILYLKTGERPATNERLAQLQKEDPGGACIVDILNEYDPREKALLDQAIVHPDAAIASDAVPWQVGPMQVREDVWPLPPDAVSHPRSAGTYARILGRYVREGKLSLADAIRKMTLLPAQILEQSVPQMKHKGRIRVGADADIVLFDPKTVGDRATYDKPTQTSVGIRYVLVNGTPVVADGALIPSAKPGRPIRRPSR